MAKGNTEQAVRILEGRLKTTNEKLHLLKQERHTIVAQLKVLRGKSSNMNRVAALERYWNTTIKLYVLELEHGCWYIGMSRNVEKRVSKHQAGKGAMWTKLHPPISIIEIVDTGVTDESDAGKMENQLTIDWAEAYGCDFVRGGGYVQRHPKWPPELIHNITNYH